MEQTLDRLLDEVRLLRRLRGATCRSGRDRSCRRGREARVLIVGQAPGSKAHASGVPWRDDSGERLRGWMGIDEATFYDDRRVAIVPMGFCYPGAGASGDLPPRPECAPALA